MYTRPLSRSIFHTPLSLSFSFLLLLFFSRRIPAAFLSVARALAPAFIFYLSRPCARTAHPPPSLHILSHTCTLGTGTARRLNSDTRARSANRASTARCYNRRCIQRMRVRGSFCFAFCHRQQVCGFLCGSIVSFDYFRFHSIGSWAGVTTVLMRAANSRPPPMWNADKEIRGIWGNGSGFDLVIAWCHFPRTKCIIIYFYL